MTRVDHGIERLARILLQVKQTEEEHARVFSSARVTNTNQQNTRY